MNFQAWLQKVWQGLSGAGGSTIDAGQASAGGYGEYGGPGSVLRGLTGRNVEMSEVQAEVAAECRGQVLLVSRCDEAVRRLLARMRGQPAPPPAGPVYYEGFFTLATLPALTERRQADADASGAGTGWGDAGWATEEWAALGREADVLVYVFRRDAGWAAADARWYARLRAIGLPLVLVEAELPAETWCADLSPAPLPGREGEGPEKAALPAGQRAVQVRLTEPPPDGEELPADVVTLVERILALRPKLGIPLAQEIPGCRPLIARRTIRSGVVMTTLLGAQPIPLLDLPLQVALNWKMALQLAAIYGHPGLDHRSREMVGTVLWNLLLRYVIQQVLKLAPVVGWAASAALSGAGTWLLGNTLLQLYQVEGHTGPAAARLQALDGKWQAARHRAGENTTGLRGRLAGWWQRALAWYDTLLGWLAAKSVGRAKRWTDPKMGRRHLHPPAGGAGAV